MIDLNISFDKPIEPFGQAALQKLVPAADSRLLNNDSQPLKINVRLASEQVVRELNAKYSGKDESTDVLSFNYAEGVANPKAGRSGDIIISYPHLQLQAQESRTDEPTELGLLVLHGIMHILNHDHDSEENKQRFNTLQGDIMSAAGLRYREFGWKS